eukprot:gnl/MRDRNA2_/MRDRNA2_36112_c0_seq1.p1 gnl/MRDRNA2_/MRDRNA2_36112_c0~~gnl/MRDRNA2_/MRDRNA2_36112_c0_seq1.p1  ORF type:complete len:592 (+),score=83.55 gnl/MRDRNA2_/MRDRNA2_36112_c0_seq1:146-1921(+)
MSDGGSSARSLHRERWNRSSPGFLTWGEYQPPSRDASRSASRDGERRREDGSGLQRSVSSGRYRDFWLHNGDVDPHDGGRQHGLAKVQIHQTGRARDFWLHTDDGSDCCSPRSQNSARSQSSGRGRDAYRWHMSETRIPWVNGNEKMSPRPRANHTDRDRYTGAMSKSQMPFGTLEPGWDRLNARSAAPPPRSGARVAPGKRTGTPSNRSRSSSGERSLEQYLAPRSNKTQEAFLKGRDQNGTQPDGSRSAEANGAPAEEKSNKAAAQRETSTDAAQTTSATMGHTSPRPRETSSSVIGSWSPRAASNDTQRSSSVIGARSPRQETSSSVIGSGIREAQNGSNVTPRSDSDTNTSAARQIDRFNPPRRCLPPTCANLYHKQITGKTTVQELFEEEKQAIEENIDRSKNRSQSAEPARPVSNEVSRIDKHRYMKQFGGSEFWHETKLGLPDTASSEKRAVSEQPRKAVRGVYESHQAHSPVWAWKSVSLQPTVQEPDSKDLKSQLQNLCEQGSSLARTPAAYTSHPAPKCMPAVSGEGRAAGLPVELGRTVEMAEFVLHSQPNKNARQHLQFEHLRAINPPLKLAPLTLDAK